MGWEWALNLRAQSRTLRSPEVLRVLAAIANGHWWRYSCVSHPVARRVLHVASCSTDTRGGLVTLQLFVLIIAIPVGSVLNLDESVAIVCCNCVLQSGMYMVAAVHH